MRLRDVGEFSAFLSTSALDSDPLWDRELAEIQPAHLAMFYARAKVRERLPAAVDAIDRLQSALVLASFDGQIDLASSALVLHELPELESSRMLTDEFIAGLAKMRPTRRQAAVYALEQDVTPTEAMNLTWKDVLALNSIRPLARECLERANCGRHIKLPYVFWEWASHQIATPLLELRYSIESAFGMGYEQLQRRYAGMLMLDRAAEAAAFMAEVDRQSKA